jgi:hypothetical protein
VLESRSLYTKARGSRLKKTTTTVVERMTVKWGNTTKVVTIDDFLRLRFRFFLLKDRKTHNREVGRPLEQRVGSVSV